MGVGGWSSVVALEVDGNTKDSFLMVGDGGSTLMTARGGVGSVETSEDVGRGEERRLRLTMRSPRNSTEGERRRRWMMEDDEAAS